MSIIASCIIAFSMYSRIPMPRCEWNEKNMRYTLCFFPLVGLIIAALCFAWLLLCARVSLPPFVKASGVFLIPLTVTGGIHADGFMDTSDACSSFQSAEKRREILKDPHIGAFSVIRFGMLTVFVLAAASLIPLPADKLLARRTLCWALSFVTARVLSGLSVVLFQSAKREGTLFTFSSRSAKRQCVALLTLELLLTNGLALFLSVSVALTMLFGALLVFLWYRIMSYRSFGGITGDIAGWFVCVCEATATGAYAALCFIGA